MRAGRIVLLLVGLLLVLAGMGAGAAGAVAGWTHLVHRDAAGFVNTPTFDLETDTYALTAEHLELVVTPGDWTPWMDRLDVRLRVLSEEGAEPVFAGIAARDDVEAYLDNVAHDEVVALDLPGADYTTRTGNVRPRPPGSEVFWVASTEGVGPQTLEWTAQSGRWAVVVMNADATPGVQIEADGGAPTTLLGPIALALLLLALLLVGGGTGMIVAALPDEHRPGAPVPAASTASQAPERARPSPAAVTGRLDPDVSRWQWLVKWLLLLPHVVVLAALWVAFVVLTVVAGFAILFTGRYPRDIFAFNVGVLRWTWRVMFYGYSALGTDRYPPFTLADVDYPARLDVEYPLRLSRGLVVIKPWLLALPHLLIVALLTGGAASWAYQLTADQSWQISAAGGLIGLLVLVAGVAVLFTGRYPPGLFDLVVGLNRWVYRVIAYVALMTDEYPPFRLDLGGEEPPTPPPPPPAPQAGSPARNPEHAPI